MFADTTEEDIMRQMSGEEPEQRPEETGVTPQNDSGVGVPSQKKPKRKFGPPSVRMQWIIAGLALALNIGITFTTTFATRSLYLR